MKKNWIWLLVLIVTFLAGFMGGCSAPDEGGGSSAVSDSERPEVVVYAPQSGQTLRDYSFIVQGTAECTASPVSNVFLSINGVDFAPCEGTNSWSTNVTVAKNGPHTISVFAVSVDGVPGLTNTREITIDTRPVLTVRKPIKEEVLVFTDFTAAGTVEDLDNAVTNITYRLNGGEPQPVTVETNWTFPLEVEDETTNTLEVWARDERGNYSATNSRTFYVDTTAFVLTNIVIDGTLETEWTTAPAFSEPTDDECDSKSSREITGLLMTNDTNSIYIALQVEDLNATNRVSYGLYLDLDNQAGSGDSGNIWTRKIEYHPEGTSHLADVQIFGNLSENLARFEYKRWNKDLNTWNAMPAESCEYAWDYGENVLELKLSMAYLQDFTNGHPLFIRAVATEDKDISPASDVAPVDDQGSDPEAVSVNAGTNSQLWNPANDPGMYPIKRNN